MASDALIGKIIILIVVSAFIYYTFWVAILPFLLIDEGNFLHTVFPPLEYAFILSSIFGTFILGGISLFTVYHTWNYVKF